MIPVSRASPVWGVGLVENGRDPTRLESQKFFLTL